jgi:hypothetical protein
MITRAFVVVLMSVAAIGCAETPPPAATQSATEAGPSTGVRRTPYAAPRPQVPMPGTLRIVGQTASGTRVANALTAEGIRVIRTFGDRASAIDRFCSGQAEILVLDSDWTDAERGNCYGTSARLAAGQVTYVAFPIVDDLIRRTRTF